MYQTVSQIPKEELEKIEDARIVWGLIFRDVVKEDFEKVVCLNGKKTFTKENLISEISKVDSFPNYTIVPSKLGDIHIIWYGRDSLSEDEEKKMYEIFKDVFGIVNYI